MTNVIWIVADQMRAQATGYAGDPNARTPNLDRLAAEGTNFTHAVSGSPLCSPFRGALMTGRYPHNNGVTGNRYPLDENARTVAHAFADAGYRTCYVGKWHLDGDRPGVVPTWDSDQSQLVPSHRRGGFADWWAYENRNRPFDCRLHTDAGRVPAGMSVVDSADGMARFFVDWLREHATDPVFAVLSVQPPHNPYTAPAEEMARYSPGRIQLRPNVPDIPRVTERARRDLAGYHAAIERLDHNVGRVRATLDELGLTDDTYLMFFSDHGDLHGSHGQWRKTAPWEESIRIPFLVGGPSREHQNANRQDVPLGLCGIPVPADMEGTDYGRLVTTPGMRPPTWDGPPDSAYLSLPVPPGHPQSVDTGWRGVVTRDGWKYACFDDRPWLLFNLHEDPYELVNLAHDPGYHAIRARLRDRLGQWIDQTGDTPL
jgi:arylsulfatase A-like enzyme